MVRLVCLGISHSLMHLSLVDWCRVASQVLQLLQSVRGCVVAAYDSDVPTAYYHGLSVARQSPALLTSL